MEEDEASRKKLVEDAAKILEGIPAKDHGNR